MSDPSLMGRYHTPKKRLTRTTRNWLIVGALTVGVAGAGYIASTSFSQIAANDVGYSIVSETEAVASIEVGYNTKDRIQCDVRAMNDSYAIVGFKSLVFEAEETPRHVLLNLDVPLRTENLATTAGIEECYTVPLDF